ncbi:MAG: hypothetical protein ACFFDT_28995 [Candidatus Hodarchaeota archaeon]
MRDSKGRFIHGHKPIAHRDPTTGRFISVFTVVNNKEETFTVEEIVDRILREKGRG